MNIYQYHSPDYLFSSKIYHFKTLNSTNLEAIKQGNLKQLNNFDIIISDQQTQGLGRNNKIWQSPLGNLYFSIYLDFQELFFNNHHQSMTAISILAIRQAIYRLSQQNHFQEIQKLTIKWPNDLLFDNKKICGTLSAVNRTTQDNKKKSFLVIGIGLNLQNHPESQSLNNFPATNLAEIGLKINNIDMLNLFLMEFFTLYQQWQKFGNIIIRNQWLKYAYKINEKIVVNLDGKIFTGIFKNIDENFNLILETETENKIVSFCDILANDN